MATAASAPHTSSSSYVATGEGLKPSADQCGREAQHGAEPELWAVRTAALDLWLSKQQWNNTDRREGNLDGLPASPF